MTAIPRSDILYLSSEAVQNAAPSPDAMREAIELVFRAKQVGSTYLKPKISLDISPGRFFQSLVAAASQPPMALTKWIGVVGENAKRGLPSVNSLVVLNDFENGQPIAILEGNWITAARTAAMTAVAAKHLARSDSRSVGFIGAGVQARSHLAALMCVLPNISEIVVHSRSKASIESFIKEAEAFKVNTKVASIAQDAVTNMDVVVTTISPSAGLTPFINPSLFAPGVFLAAVDLGRPIKRESIRDIFQIIATDEHEQSLQVGATGRLLFPGPFDVDLGEMVTGRHPGRRSATDRAMFVFPGVGLADFAIAVAVYNLALERNLGLRLPR
jgi:ornithine cyclodeaminase/alanine dehydrogenase